MRQYCLQCNDYRNSSDGLSGFHHKTKARPMIQISPPYTPPKLARGDHFSAYQYPRQAFGGVIDPVLNIDWFTMQGPTFPEHPHAGFSAVTYLFADSANGFRNRDSLGQQHVIRPGGLHWSRASKGMMHEEVPLADGGAVQGLQIFINLPAANQGDEPAAFPVQPGAVQIETGHGWTRRTAVDGTGVGGIANALPAPVRIEEVTIDPAATYPLDLPAGWGGIMIVLGGDVTLPGSSTVTSPQAIGFAMQEAASVDLAAGEQGGRIAIVTGQQLHQPVHAFGPLMLASAEALARARQHVADLAIPHA